MSEDELRALDRRFEAEAAARWQPFYDDRTRACPFFVDDPDEHLVAWAQAGLLPRGHALDLGCGHGRNALWLARQGWQVDALDLSASGVAWAAERVASAGVAVHVSQGSVFELDRPAASADLVVDSGLFHHLAPHRRPGYVARVAGWLRPGGVLVLACFRPEGGSGVGDAQAYAQGRLGGGFGFDEAALRACWEPALAIEALRPMNDEAPGSGRFGRQDLWACRARKAGLSGAPA